MTAPLVSLADIESAAERIRGIAVRTPLVHVAGGPSSGGSLDPPGFSLKCESFQPMGAFKIRGAANMLARLGGSARGGVITYSSGNHGQAVALAARRLGVAAVVVMPETATQVKVDGTRRHGAEVVFAGTTSLDRKAVAETLAAERGLTMVPPFDHPWIVAGAGTVGLEILEQQEQLSAVYVPMGGGGLVAGVSTVIKARRPEVRVIGVEPAGAPKMTASRAAGHPVTLERSASIADGLLNLRPGELTFAHVQAYVDEVVTVSDDDIRAAIRWLFREARLVAEPSGAATTAAVLAAGASGPSGIVAILSGGNVSIEDYVGYLRSK